MLLVLAVLAAAVYLAVRRVHAWSRLRHIPGPAWAGWSNIWVIWRAWRGSLYEDLGRLCEQHGPLIRVGPNQLVCGDPLEIRRLWAVRSDFDRSEWWKGFQLEPGTDCTISMRDGELHSMLRSKIAPGYAGKGLDSLHETIDKQIAQFIRVLEDKYLSTEAELKPVDFARKVQYLTLDVISTLAFGRTFGFVEADSDLFDYIKTTEASVPLMMIICLKPLLSDLLRFPLLKALLPSDKDVLGLGKIMAIAKDVVAERYGEKKITKRDMLGSFVSHGLSQKDAEAESLVQIIAGSDTTAAVVRMGIFLITTSPTVHKQLQHEIDTTRLSHPATDAEARAMPYLQACIKEIFRYSPPVTGIMPRISPRESTICNIRVPPRTDVGWSARSVFRSKEIFGDDAELYWPDRWVRQDTTSAAGKKKLLDMERTVDLVFGAGKWGCLGKPISLIETNKIFVELLRRFDFTVVDPVRPVEEFNYGLAMHSGMFMKISRRRGVGE
ncbi:hypothetical protein FQN55_008669 [Onygenales sp. PD_40]|nr:hypothetical protein FQN55_008669 [Onygenales sp. PD_40]